MLSTHLRVWPTIWPMRDTPTPEPTQKGKPLLKPNALPFSATTAKPGKTPSMARSMTDPMRGSLNLSREPRPNWTFPTPFSSTCSAPLNRTLFNAVMKTSRPFSTTAAVVPTRSDDSSSLSTENEALSLPNSPITSARVFNLQTFGKISP